MSAQAPNEKTIVDSVLSKITKFQSAGELILPKDYSAENALKSAYLILSETLDRDKKLVLETCTPTSIANSLLDMVVQGLSPVKNQCYFIAYGKTLQLSRSYMGSVAVAKRAGLKSVVANVIYTDDVFAYQIDNKTGLVSILEHSQNIMNIDISKIRGAYAIATMEDGTSNVTVMTYAQIKQSWLQGAANGNSGAHKNFTDEMCKKTVINRACKLIINTSNDLVVLKNEDEETENENAPETAAANSQKISMPTTAPAATLKQAIPEFVNESPAAPKADF